jgi:Glycosyl transferase family group 2
MQDRRCTAWSAARRSSVAGGNGDGCELLVVVVPMYQEELIAAETVAYWHALVQTAEVDEVVFVTTAKEVGTGRPTTQVMLTEALAHLQSSHLRHLHCVTVTRFRAAQLNLAISDARDRHCHSESGKAGFWIGVYNADSRPEPSTFRELRQFADLHRDTRAYQQLARYVVPDRAGVSRVATGNAVLQTWWTRTHYWARNTRGGGSPHWRASTSPFSTFGHGEFIRLDLLDEIGGFPDFAYADGLLLGWIFRLMDEPIGLLASADQAEVPRTARDLLTQQRAWMQGLLNFATTLRWVRDSGRLRLAEPEAAVLGCQHVIIPIAWGLSTPAVAAGMALMIERLRRKEAMWADWACLFGLASYPVIPALAHAAEGGEASHPSRLLATAWSWTIEGLAFWPALLSHFRKSQAAPAKTPR